MSEPGSLGQNQYGVGNPIIGDRMTPEPTRQWLIDDYAGRAMQSLLQQLPRTHGKAAVYARREDVIAGRAFSMAKAMLAERDRILAEASRKESPEARMPSNPTLTQELACRKCGAKGVAERVANRDGCTPDPTSTVLRLPAGWRPLCGDQVGYVCDTCYEKFRAEHEKILARSALFGSPEAAPATGDAQDGQRPALA